MQPSPAEQSLRLVLPILRLLGAYIPLPLERWASGQSMQHLRLKAGVTRQAVSADGVACDWLIPDAGREQKVLIYLHGGGFVSRATVLHMQMAASLAQKLDVRALMVDYRLAPEHPFPAALQDCITAWRWLLKLGFAAQNLLLAGDSAGGNLAIATTMQLRQAGEPLPGALACISPVIDLSEHTASADGFRDPLLHPRAMHYYNTSYLAGHNPRDPLVSPAFGDWHALPPLLVHVGEDEILRQDALQIETLARAAGVDVRLEVFPRMWHDFQLYRVPQARQSLEGIAQFLGSHLG